MLLVLEFLHFFLLSFIMLCFPAMLKEIFKGIVNNFLDVLVYIGLFLIGYSISCG